MHFSEPFSLTLERAPRRRLDPRERLLADQRGQLRMEPLRLLSPVGPLRGDEPFREILVLPLRLCELRTQLEQPRLKRRCQRPPRRAPHATPAPSGASAISLTHRNSSLSEFERVHQRRRVAAVLTAGSLRRHQDRAAARPRARANQATATRRRAVRASPDQRPRPSIRSSHESGYVPGRNALHDPSAEPRDRHAKPCDLAAQYAQRSRAHAVHARSCATRARSISTST